MNWAYILIVIIVVCFILQRLVNKKTIEGFGGFGSYGGYGYHSYYPYRYCSKCGYKSRRKCADCTNCGYCLPYRGPGECVPGDNNGPYFRQDCMVWEYNSPYNDYAHIFPRLDYPYRYWRYGNRYPYITNRRSWRRSGYRDDEDEDEYKRRGRRRIRHRPERNGNGNNDEEGGAEGEENDLNNPTA